jgi:hypothetical protein
MGGSDSIFHVFCSKSAPRLAVRRKPYCRATLIEKQAASEKKPYYLIPLK